MSEIAIGLAWCSALTVPNATTTGTMSPSPRKTRLASIASTFCPSASTPVVTIGPSRTHAGNNTAIAFCTVMSAPLSATMRNGAAMRSASLMSGAEKPKLRRDQGDVRDDDQRDLNGRHRKRG